MVENIVLNIATPKGVYESEFPKTTKIKDVIQAVITAMELEGGDSFELVANGQELKPVDRPLVSFHLESPVHMELVATGSGV